MSWLAEPPALLGPVEYAGEPVVDSESEGEWRAKRDELPPPAPPPCEADDKLATDAAGCELFDEVVVRRSRDSNWLADCCDPVTEGDVSEFTDDAEDCRLGPCRLTLLAAWLEVWVVGEKACLDGLPAALDGLDCTLLLVEIGVRPRRGA